MAAVSLAALGASAIGGWAAANTIAVAGQDRPQAESRIISMPDYSPGAAVRMPDVRGLSDADAQQALVDAGVPASTIEVSQRPAAGEPGRVVQQMPVFGSVNPAAVSIVISTQAEIPESAGRPASQVISELQGLGARVEQQRVYDPDTEVGDAIRTEPAAGARLPETVTIFIADSPVTLPLGDLETVGSSSYWSEDVLHGGQTYDYAATYSASDPEYSLDSFGWTLGGSVSTIEGFLALEEDFDAGFAANVVVLGDGEEIARLALTSANASAFEWDVRGVDTLVMQVTRAGEDGYGSIVMLDAVALGSFSDAAVAP